MINVKEMYDYAVQNNLKLLSNYSSSFWTYYLNNSSYFDSFFSKRFKNFIYFNQEDDSLVQTVTTEFIHSVYEWLLVNDKRYSELFRPFELTDAEYSILHDYDITTTHSGQNDHRGAFIAGQRTDVNINNIGSQEFANLNKVSPFNSNNENSHDSSNSANGNRQDILQFTKGQQENTDSSQETKSFNERSFGLKGGRTPAELLELHNKVWKVNNFYLMVLDEISREYLSFS